MNRLSRDEVTHHMPLTPDELYALVSDVTLTPKWSPEVISCRWVEESGHAVPGAVFVARNRRGRFVWSNRPVVEIADPGREFTFARTEHGGGTMRWSYRFAPTGTGTNVTLSYQAVKPVPVGLHLILRLFGTPDLQTDLRNNMTTSLQRLNEYAQTRRPTGPPLAPFESAALVQLHFPHGDVHNRHRFDRTPFGRSAEPRVPSAPDSR